MSVTQMAPPVKEDRPFIAGIYKIIHLEEVQKGYEEGSFFKTIYTSSSLGGKVNELFNKHILTKDFLKKPVSGYDYLVMEVHHVNRMVQITPGDHVIQYSNGTVELLLGDNSHRIIKALLADLEF